MQQGRFYFLKDEYFERFPDCGLMKNKETDALGNSHSRPCYYCVENNGLFWFVPISSKVEKYKSIYDYKSSKLKSYDGIRFGYVNGLERAFLLQNVCPVSEKYIDSMYMIEKGTKAVTIDEDLDKELTKIVNKIINLNKKGISITLSKIDYILKTLSLD